MCRVRSPNTGSMGGCRFRRLSRSRSCATFYRRALPVQPRYQELVRAGLDHGAGTIENSLGVQPLKGDWRQARLNAKTGATTHREIPSELARRFIASQRPRLRLRERGVAREWPGRHARRRALRGGDVHRRRPAPARPLVGYDARTIRGDAMRMNRRELLAVGLGLNLTSSVALARQGGATVDRSGAVAAPTCRHGRPRPPACSSRPGCTPTPWP